MTCRVQRLGQGNWGTGENDLQKPIDDVYIYIYIHVSPVVHVQYTGHVFSCVYKYCISIYKYVIYHISNIIYHIPLNIYIYDIYIYIYMYICITDIIH